MRDITKVIHDIKTHVPEHQRKMIRQLDDILTSVPYAAPEALGYLWERLQGVMQKYVPLPTQAEWQVQVISIYSTLLPAQVRAIRREEHPKEH